MKEIRDKIAEDRTKTDASLDAERASADAERAALTPQQASDDLGDRERAASEQALSTFREDADRSRARERHMAPASESSGVAHERHRADDGTKAEREATDAILLREREISDASLAQERRADDLHQVQQEERRQETNERLLKERDATDVAVDTLAETQSSLERNQDTSLTERTRAEKVLRETERQLRQAQKMEAIGMLAGGVAHDFNNLLSVVLSYAELLLDDLTPGAIVRAEMRADVMEIRKAGTRAAELTRQLLIFSRQQVIEPKVVDLNEVLSGVENMLKRILGADVELVWRPTAALGRVRVDPGGMEQVIMNLVVNARDAMPTGGKLTMETTNVVLDAAHAREHLGVEPGPHVVLAVTDTGCGMDSETQARIFEPFFTTKDKSKGTGLGLSTVFGIMKQNGGSVWVQSEPGKGTTFELYLPRVDAPIDSVRVPEAPPTLLGSETILLVEDDDQVRAVAGAILRKSGYDVIEAGNAQEAVSNSASHRGVIHLLISDVVMPQVSGPALAERLAKTRPHMKVLCMSGYTDDSNLRHGVLSAQLAYLQKPITPESLTTKVREVLASTT